MPPTPRPEPGRPATGADPFREPRRDDCPWCGSRQLRTRVRAPEGGRRTPGTFVVDECQDCAHAFQNPRPTADALLLGRHRHPAEDDERAALDARRRRRHHRGAARALPAYSEPESWLDVGTGHGHFPEAARAVHPYTSFDGIDATRGVRRAWEEGRVEEAYQGLLTDPEITARLRARYDVVSMLQHLEHTADPRDELRAAHAVLRPGGHLLLEVPDPARPFGSRRYWRPRDRPRPLHLMPLRNLLAELGSLGYEILAARRCTPLPARAHRVLARRTAPQAPPKAPGSRSSPP
ncbi:class I SAM-dependent methyltransferase [Streptomyces scabiei]|uniref:class I SAM-dependent methyltransferase n=1 Tax=Streptomyces scabiei TaxID=1930 RepID=UPI000774651D|nr:class I SAM-dependent methyltransferase [Streptomyces scabiei]MDX3203698.1 class I SAM-dependent methyltransferase [Streptomyces scabiei]MDX3217198.1 class I SAM-dependent methyltransferase [Streptomyces scabiei]